MIIFVNARPVDSRTLNYALIESYHESLTAVATTAGGTYNITGKVINLIPLRNRRTTPEGEQLMTRISEGMTEWTCDVVDRPGYGLSEYLDQIIDGQPVGIEG